MYLRTKQRNGLEQEMEYMNTTILVEVFFVVSVIVFALTLYIIVPISLVKKKVVFKEYSILNRKNTFLKKDEIIQIGKPVEK